MRTTDTLFAGSIARAYEQLMVPMLFEPYAVDIAERASAHPHGDILETACGTGAVTRAVHEALPGSNIVAIDLNPAMLAIAGEKLRSPNVRFQAADAQQLPFDDQCFDLVICQFGIMFFPDKAKANREARRVLRSGGHYLLLIWDRLEQNPFSKAIHEAVAAQFPDDPPAFLPRIPFGYCDLETITADLVAAGFDDLEFETVVHQSLGRSAIVAARAMCEGSPLRSEIEARDPGSMERVIEAAAAALRPFEVPGGVAAAMSAHLVTAAK